MPDIRHAIQIQAKPEDIYPLIARATGFSQWWAADEPPARAEWVCETGDEWNGTRIVVQYHVGRADVQAEGKGRGPLFLAGDMAY